MKDMGNSYLLTFLQQVQVITDHFKPIKAEGLFWKHALWVSALLGAQSYIFICTFVTNYLGKGKTS